VAGFAQVLEQSAFNCAEAGQQESPDEPQGPEPTPHTPQASLIHCCCGVHVGGNPGNEGPKDGGNDGAGAVGVTALDGTDVALTP